MLISNRVIHIKGKRRKKRLWKGIKKWRLKKRTTARRYSYRLRPLVIVHLRRDLLRRRRPQKCFGGRRREVGDDGGVEGADEKIRAVCVMRWWREMVVKKMMNENEKRKEKGKEKWKKGKEKWQIIKRWITIT